MKNVTTHNKDTQIEKGFTLIETLLAVFIFSLALVSLITIAGQGIKGTRTAEDQIVALNLAQEGIEVARHVRDSEMLANPGQNPLQNIDQGCPCHVDYTTGIPTLGSGSVSLMKTSSATNSEIYYAVNNSGAQQFQRRIKFIEVNSGQNTNDQIRVNSKVKWQDANGVSREVSLTSLLTNWQE